MFAPLSFVHVPNARGNAFFKKKEFAEAAKLYHTAVSYMETLKDHASIWDEDEVVISAFQPSSATMLLFEVNSSQTVARCEALRLPLHLNLAACKLKVCSDATAAALVQIHCTSLLGASFAITHTFDSCHLRAVQRFWRGRAFLQQGARS